MGKKVNCTPIFQNLPPHKVNGRLIIIIIIYFFFGNVPLAKPTDLWFTLYVAVTFEQIIQNIDLSDLGCPKKGEIILIGQIPSGCFQFHLEEMVV